MIIVRRPGLLTTVQDLGRPGLGHLGVPTAGAVDRAALRLANRLVGNPEQAAGLEATLIGPNLEFAADTYVALTGGRAVATLDGTEIEPGSAIRVRRGQRLRLGRITAGVRAYLGVRGGIDVPPILGSRSTDTLAGLGPPRLVAGTELPLGRVVAGPVPGGRIPSPVPGAELELRVLPGPRADAFGPEATRTLADSAYVVTPASDRTGVRLAGPALRRRSAAELASEGMVEGALQVPGDGQPILLLANHPATGGYPVIAVLLSADLALAAQARPGTRLWFRPVSRPVG